MPWTTIFQTTHPSICLPKVHRETPECLSKRAAASRFFRIKRKRIPPRNLLPSSWKSVGASPLGRTYPRASSSRPDRCFPDDRPRKIPGIDLLATILLEIVPARCGSYGPDAVYRCCCEVGHCTLPFSLPLSSFSVYHLPLWAGDALGCREKIRDRQVSGMARDAFGFFGGWNVLRDIRIRQVGRGWRHTSLKLILHSSLFFNESFLISVACEDTDLWHDPDVLRKEQQDLAEKTRWRKLTNVYLGLLHV